MKDQDTTPAGTPQALDEVIQDLRVILATIATEPGRQLPAFEAHALLTRFGAREAAEDDLLSMRDVDAFCERLTTLDIKHPGRIFAEEFFPAFGVSARYCAQELGITPAMLSLFMNGKRGIGSELAVKLAKLCGTSPAFWLRAQALHELVSSARDLSDRLRPIHRLEQRQRRQA